MSRTFRDFVARERPRVDIDWEPARDVLAVRMYRRDGTWRSVAVTSLALAEARMGPVQLIRDAFRGDTLDQAAIQLLARDRIQDLSGNSRPHWLTPARVRAVIGAAATYRETQASVRPLAVPLPPEADRRLRTAVEENQRRIERAAFFGGLARPQEPDKPEPLAPPNPDLPMHPSHGHRGCHARQGMGGTLAGSPDHAGGLL